MKLFLAKPRILYRDYQGFVQRISKRLKDHAQMMAQAQNRPDVDLDSPSVSKEQIARRIIKRDGVQKSEALQGASSRDR